MKSDKRKGGLGFATDEFMRFTERAKDICGRPFMSFYDDEVDAITLRAGGYEGEVKYVIKGVAEFVIYADEFGAWQIDLHVKKWESEKDQETAKKIL
jgi:hypothetical protein